ncbi:MAG: hypothetical protein IJ089_14005 [Clostridia bacterium]|nr:hypothetical protein [Clostridia bacterium]MBQ8964879.1 hypothetical protein [Clostridia bacterium]
MLLKELLVFRDDLYFDGAVQADWLYHEDRVAPVASSFVFHGPSTHAVARETIGHQNLMDTASFTLRLAEKMNDPEQGSPFSLAIAGYGTGKSHLAVALSVLFSGENWMPEVHTQVMENIRRADTSISKALKPLVEKPHLVLTLNGMRDFNLHYELLRTAEKALSIHHIDHTLISKLDRRREVAEHFIHHSFDVLVSQFNQCAADRGIAIRDEALKETLISDLGDVGSQAFKIVNHVYTDFNGHPIRMDEGVSAGTIIETLLKEYCGLHGKFDGVVILFDEFGRFLEYAGSNPAAAGDSALQQIFETVQNAQGDVQFVGFIQSDIKSYLQRVDKTSNISRYIDRYDAGEKIYLSSNLETVFANLLEHPDTEAFNRYVLSRLQKDETYWKTMHRDMSAWLTLEGIWSRWPDFQRILLNAIYPLHPISTWLLCHLTDWLQSRSSLTLLSEKVRQMGMTEISDDARLPMIYPVDLIRGAFFSELLNAEEQGRQRSQFCILVNNILRKFETKFSADEVSLLLANLIVRICRFRFENRQQLTQALSICANLSEVQVVSALRILEDEYAVLSYDERLICFDFVADSIGAGDFRRYLNAAKLRTAFEPRFINLESVQKCAAIEEPIPTNFGIGHGIMTKEWVFDQCLLDIREVNADLIKRYIEQLKRSTEPETAKGLMMWVYVEKDIPKPRLDDLCALVKTQVEGFAMTIFLLDDAENRLKEAILEYVILCDMSKEEQARYHRFYADALSKAEERLSAEFTALKQERKRVFENEIERIDKRMSVYLTQVFADLYPKAVPFDFDGFQSKSIAKARKQFCAMMKWILMEHLSYPSLKSQTVEVRGRVESVIAGSGLHSWRCLNEHYQAIIPMHSGVRAIYEGLQGRLETDGHLIFSEEIALLNAPPYGLNDYAVFLLIGIVCETLSYTTRLEYKGERMSGDKWAEKVVSDNKISMKALSETRLIYVDTEKTGDRFRQLFRLINNTIDLTLVPKLVAQLDALETEESVPEALQSDYALARMRLDEGIKAVEVYKQAVASINQSFSDAKEKHDAFTAMKVALKAREIAEKPASANGTFRYNDEQLQKLAKAAQTATRLAEKLFDVWIPAQRCNEVGRLKNYEKHIKTCIDLMRQLGFEQQAQALKSLSEKEAEHLNVLIARQSLRENGENYLRTSIVTRGIAMKALLNMADQGEALLKVYHSFDYASIPQLRTQHDRIVQKVTEIRETYEQQKAELNAVWDRIYTMESVQEMRLIARQVHALLESGLTDQDRDDFEQVSRFIDDFLSDMDAADQYLEDPERYHNMIEAMREKYEDEEVSVVALLDAVEADFSRSIDEKEQQWTEEYLSESVLEESVEALNQWKRETAVLPRYLSSDTRELYLALLQKVDAALTEKKLAYIELLFKELNEEEKEQCRVRLGIGITAYGR